MIKVIASDMDGTLLGDDYHIAHETIDAIKRAKHAGIRFIIVTGRNFREAWEEVKNTGIVCDFISSSGAEVRNYDKQIVCINSMSKDTYKEVIHTIQTFGLSPVINSGVEDYMIGTPEEVEYVLVRELRMFCTNISEQEIRKTPLFARMMKYVKAIPDIDFLCEKDLPIYKIGVTSNDEIKLATLKAVLEKNPKIAVASSIKENLEITSVYAQKGPVLKAYIESIGYTMDEIMVLGDSLNDYSMISMNFGETIAMENATDELKVLAKRVAQSNENLGVAREIERVLKENTKYSRKS